MSLPISTSNDKQQKPLEIAGDSDPSAGYDPERALAGMKAAAGSWSDLDTEEMKEFIYRAREEGTRPKDRPAAF